MQQQVVPPAVESVAEADAGQRTVPWVLAVITALAGILAAKSLLSDWVIGRVYVNPLKNDELHHDFGYFGARGVGFAVGLVVLLVLVGLALWRTGRLRSWLAYAAVALTGLLLVDFLLMVLAVDELRAEAAGTVVNLQNELRARGEVPEGLGLDIATQGLYVGAFAALLLGLVALQLPRPRSGPWIQAWCGAVLGLAALPVPWVRSWVSFEYRLDVRDTWLWSLGAPGIGLILGLLVLMALTVVTLRAPGYARWRWALGVAGLGILLFLGAVIAETDALQAVHDVRRSSDVALLDAKTTGMAGLFGTGVVLLTLAAARAFWWGREEVAPAESDDRWLPGRLAARRD